METVDVIVSVLTLIIGWILGVRSEKSAKEQLRIDAMTFTSGWYSDLRSWASESINVLTESAYLCSDSNGQSKKETKAQLLICRSTISALIDRGRFYFPNDFHNDYGIDKPSAYRGVRQPILDYLVAAENVLSGKLNPSDLGYDTMTSALVEIKRLFVSVSQTVLDPRGHISEINKVLSTARAEQNPSDSSLIKYLNNKMRSTNQ